MLENHLQAEIAAEIQRLLQAAERRSTPSTGNCTSARPPPACATGCCGSRSAEEEGAPVGLDAARKRLLNTSADLWSAEDRRVVGAMLQQRIGAERERADAADG